MSRPARLAALSVVILMVPLAAHAQRRGEVEEDAPEEEAPAPRPRRTQSPDEAAAAALATKDPQAALRLRYIESRIKSASMFRIAGIVLTAIGGAGMAGGVGLTVFAYSNTSGGFSGSERASAAGAGVAVLVLGAAAVGIGVPLWITGHTRYKRYDEQREKILFGAVPLPGGAAAHLALRF